MYNSHNGARKVMEKGRKISWTATTQGMGRGVYQNLHMSTRIITSPQRKRKRYFLLFWGDHQKISCQAQIYLVSALV
jgi:hypothetical protein